MTDGAEFGVPQRSRSDASDRDRPGSAVRRKVGTARRLVRRAARSSLSGLEALQIPQVVLSVLADRAICTMSEGFQKIALSGLDVAVEN